MRSDRFLRATADGSSGSVRPAARRPSPSCLGGDVDRFCADLVAKTGVLLLPGTLFDAGDAHFRLGYGRSDLPRGLRVLEEYLSV